MNQQTTIWDHITAAPHRSLFLVGALQGVFTLLWWVFDLSGRYAVAGQAVNWNVAPTWAHAFLMIFENSISQERLIFYFRFFVYHIPELDEWSEDKTSCVSIDLFVNVLRRITFLCWFDSWQDCKYGGSRFDACGMEYCNLCVIKSISDDSASR